jgi:putative Mg2+ transporter-C (MgtC) family protein
MIEFSQMMLRLALALGLGGILGFERELVGKEAGTRTTMVVAGGAAIFTMIGLNIPYLLARNDPMLLSEIISRNSGFITIIANIVVGIGFLGAGTILKQNDHVRGLTTAAVIWFAAAIGVVVGMGQFEFAAGATFLIAVLLYTLRSFGVTKGRRLKK